MSERMIPYYRVSTEEQEESGLGLEGQRRAVDAYVQSTGGIIVESYEEVETGTNKQDRPILEKALAHARFAGATLVIAKMDRLTRNLGFLTRLEESKVNFVACDMPHANKLVIRIMVVIAEHEAEMISHRTKVALEAYKANRKVSKRLRKLYPDGVPEQIVNETAGKLGASLPQCQNLTDKDRRKGADAAGKVHALKAHQFNSYIAPQILALRTSGLSFQAIADKLNADGHLARRGGKWHHVQVMRICLRHGKRRRRS